MSGGVNSKSSKARRGQIRKTGKSHNNEIMGRNDEITVYQITYASCFVHEFYNRVLNLREWIFHEIQVRA